MVARTYARRGGLRGADEGIRKVAPSFGKSVFLTHSDKASNEDVFAVEHDAERLVAQMLSFDPEILRFSPQALTVDLVSGGVYSSREQVAEARARYKRLKVQPILYTPDFLGTRALGLRKAVEVKLQGFEGDEDYAEKLGRARQIMWAHGIDFVKVVFPSYWRHPLWTNLPLLHQASKRRDLRPGPEVMSRIDALEVAGARTLRDYLAGLGYGPQMAPVLVAFGALCVDLFAEQMRGDTVAAPAHGTLDHLQLLARLAQ